MWKKKINRYINNDILTVYSGESDEEISDEELNGV